MRKTFVFAAVILTAVLSMGGYSFGGPNERANERAHQNHERRSANTNEPQPLSSADDNNTGANQRGDFDSTRDGTPADHGGGRNNTGKVAAQEGKADNKNPPGQSLNDRNRGYECDGNQGVGRGNPAHSGCRHVTVTPPTTVPPTTVVEEPTITTATVSRPSTPPPSGEELPRTGSNLSTLVLVGLGLVVVGAGLRKA